MAASVRLLLSMLTLALCSVAPHPPPGTPKSRGPGHRCPLCHKPTKRLKSRDYCAKCVHYCEVGERPA
jgi:hypothetical protein